LYTYSYIRQFLQVRLCKKASKLSLIIEGYCKTILIVEVNTLILSLPFNSENVIQ